MSKAMQALYMLPALPPAFGSSAAAQALLAAVRTLSPGHADVLASELNRALVWQLKATLIRALVRTCMHLRMNCSFCL